MKKKLYRTEGEDRKLAGVCGGLAEYFDADPGIVRIAAAAAILLCGIGLWIYIIAALVLPNKSKAYPEG